MHLTRGSVERAQGMTLLELVFSAGLIGILMGSVLVGFLKIQDTFLESQLVSRIQLRAQRSLERVVLLAGQAVTSDTQFSPLLPTTGVNSHALRFRLIDSLDPVTGAPIYDDLTPVYIYGPDSGASPNRGLVIGRGTDLAAIHAAGAGADGFLGTTDDSVNLSLGNGVPAVELLLPEEFLPSTGEMFTVNVTPAPLGRLLTFTLRVNARGRDGTFMMDQDVVLSERVALRQ